MRVATTVSIEISMGREAAVGVDAPCEMEDDDAVLTDVRAECSWAE